MQDGQPSRLQHRQRRKVSLNLPWTRLQKPASGSRVFMIFSPPSDEGRGSDMAGLPAPISTSNPTG
eukprot:762665-Hanusia_phi.AAC.3